jgi:hypothetical protein
MAESVTCPICSNLCSTQATSCPKCGHPINPIKPREKFLELRAIRVGLWILFIPAAMWALECPKILLEMPYALSGYANEERTAAIISVFFKLGFFLFISTLLYVSHANKRKQ